MLNKEFLILVCIFAIVIDVYSKPTLLTSGIRYCYKQECPENTFACERLTHTSEDKKYLVAEIHCLDVKGKVPLNQLRTVNYVDVQNFKKMDIRACCGFNTMAPHPTLPCQCGVPDCFKEECPENTLACERFAHLSKDKKHIVAEIHCLDLRGNVLKNVTNYEDNPFEPTTNYKGYSFQGAVQISTMKGRDEYLSKESHGISKNKNTELDDLNN